MTDPDRQGLPILPFASQTAWSEWLAANHDTSRGLWLKIAKAGSGNDSVTYAEAVDAALLARDLLDYLPQHAEQAPARWPSVAPPGYRPDAVVPAAEREVYDVRDVARAEW